ncbi:hypothetical protein J7T55_001473 [Diaporthe amygdali]|uniref:uncharacterized protein n=1 Tax=Phomopsis amygdali TaxID=1214568 RepID=UPI0022FE06A3|nr:uncharacterized protein J7T55_001473 [Diaporthe amygdali]KAJ0115064.1 hypothetical protein J7T55_001473 [Diaporthe amygdali]
MLTLDRSVYTGNLSPHISWPTKLQLKWHDKYGTVVRIGPNHLSFTDARAWRDIYGHRTGPGKQEFSKSRVAVGLSMRVSTHIVNAGIEDHSRLRRALSHGFSDKAIRSQEPTIVRHVDKLIHGLRSRSVGHWQEDLTDGHALNLEEWFNWTTFDVIGELVFGMSFGCLDRFEYHPWVSSFLQSFPATAANRALHYVRLGWVASLIFKTTGWGGKAMRDMGAHTEAMVRFRLGMGEEPRDDLLEGLIKKQDEWKTSFEELSANAMILTIAGSETTATLLSGCVFLLLAHPEKFDRVKSEIRSEFQDESELTITSINRLPYMLAVLNEALRLYPPITSTLIRDVPIEGEYVAGNFVPGGVMVEVQPWSINHSGENWDRPWEFRPERFLDKGTANVLEALQDFSYGPRNCLGRNLAFVEMRFILARLVYNFDLTLDPESHRWIERQKNFSALWTRIPLKVIVNPVRTTNT